MRPSSAEGLHAAHAHELAARPGLIGVSPAGLLGAIGRIPTFEAIRYREFRLIWLGQGGIGMATWMDQVARGWLMYQLTDSALQLGLVRLIQAVPYLLMSPIAGALADRYDRKTQFLVAQVMDGLLYLLMAVLIFSGRIAPWHLYVTAFGTAMMQAFEQPARHSLVSDSVPTEHLTNAIGLNSMLFNVCRTVGPAVAGAVIAVWGTGASYGIQTILYLLATIWTVQLRSGPRSRDEQRRVGSWSFFGSNVEALRFMGSNEIVRTGILVVMLASLFAMPFATLLPVFARDVLQAGPTGQGLLLTSMGIGALTSAVLIASFGNRLPKGMLMLAGATCYGLALVAFSLSNWFLISALFIMVAGLCNVACNALIQTIVQTHTPPELRGRVMSVFQQNQVVLTVG